MRRAGAWRGGVRFGLIFPFLGRFMTEGRAFSPKPERQNPPGRRVFGACRGRRGGTPDPSLGCERRVLTDVSGAYRPVGLLEACLAPIGRSACLRLVRSALAVLPSSAAAILRTFLGNAGDFFGSGGDFFRTGGDLLGAGVLFSRAVGSLSKLCLFIRPLRGIFRFCAPQH